MNQRLAMKNGQAKTSQQERAEKKPVAIAKKSAKKIASEKQAKGSKETTLAQFFETMIECAPEFCMETGVRLNYTITPTEVVCHILPKKPTAVPSMAKNPLNIVYLNIDTHHKMDADLGVKSKGEYVRSMKIFPLLLERVAQMWKHIPQKERKNVPFFLRPL